MPAAGFAQFVSNESGDELVLSAIVVSPDGLQLFKHRETGNDPFKLGEKVALQILNSEAGALLQSLKQSIE